MAKKSKKKTESQQESGDERYEPGGSSDENKTKFIHDGGSGVDPNGSNTGSDATAHGGGLGAGGGDPGEDIREEQHTLPDGYVIDDYTGGPPVEPLPFPIPFFPAPFPGVIGLEPIIGLPPGGSGNSGDEGNSEDELEEKKSSGKEKPPKRLPNPDDDNCDRAGLPPDELLKIPPDIGAFDPDEKKLIEDQWRKDGWEWRNGNDPVPGYDGSMFLDDSPDWRKSSGYWIKRRPNGDVQLYYHPWDRPNPDGTDTRENGLTIGCPKRFVMERPRTVPGTNRRM